MSWYAVFFGIAVKYQGLTKSHLNLFGPGF